MHGCWHAQGKQGWHARYDLHASGACNLSPATRVLDAAAMNQRWGMCAGVESGMPARTHALTHARTHASSSFKHAHSTLPAPSRHTGWAASWAAAALGTYFWCVGIGMRARSVCATTPD